MNGANLSTVGVMRTDDPGTNDKIELVAMMLPTGTLSRLRTYCAAANETQNRVIAAAVEQYIAARKPR
ncbi:MAG: hypothetical protein ACOC95_01105 [Planctomycetota bacterium]